MMTSRYRVIGPEPRRRADHSEIHLSGVDGVRAGDPIEKQQPGAMVDFVLQRPCLEGIRGDSPFFIGTGESPDNHQLSGPFDVAGQVGHGHTALAALLPLGRLFDAGLQSTNGPWQVLAFGWPVTSTAKTCADTPTWGAASPTHPGETRIDS